MKKFVSLLLVAVLLFSVASVTTGATGVPSNWAAQEVQWASSYGLVSTAASQDYQKNVTRLEFCELAMLLYQKLAGNMPQSPENPFSDTDNDFVLKAYSLGIVKGVSEDEFAPDNSISRQEICVMLARCISAALGDSKIASFKSVNFADRNLIADWACPSVDYAFSNNIIKGIGNDKIDPLGTTTCEQAILMIYRIFANKDGLYTLTNLPKDEKITSHVSKEGMNYIISKVHHYSPIGFSIDYDASLKLFDSNDSLVITNNYFSMEIKKYDNSNIETVKSQILATMPGATADTIQVAGKQAQLFYTSTFGESKEVVLFENNGTVYVAYMELSWEAMEGIGVDFCDALRSIKFYNPIV